MERSFEMKDLTDRRRRSGKPWMEFLRAEALSMGIYVLPVGTEDLQKPHTEDEVYYIVSGRGRLIVDGTDQPVGPGTLMFVPAAAEHRFHDITEELTALVFFAPAEGSRAAAAV